MQTHPQGEASILEVFLNQRVSAYCFHESLNLGTRSHTNRLSPKKNIFSQR